jgi:hypothetical protein
MSEQTDAIVNREFRFNFRKKDLFWYIYGVVFTVFNGVFLGKAITQGDVGGIIVTSLILLFVIAASILIPQFEQRSNFYHKKWEDLNKAFIDDLVSELEKAYSVIEDLTVKNKDLTVRNEKLEARRPVRKVQ